LINLIDEHGNQISVLSSRITKSTAQLTLELCELIVLIEARVQGMSLDSAYLEVRTTPEHGNVETYEYYKYLEY
jgi:hypothetical protein